MQIDWRLAALNNKLLAFGTRPCYTIIMPLIQRSFWIEALKKGWRKRSVLWLSGVRRAGKTSLCKSLSKIDYFDCELPRTRNRLEDAEAFLDSLNASRIVVLDEIHRLPNPSELLKIAADHYPKIKIVATGSSTLGASVKFKDTLAGRKQELWLTPMNARDLIDFNHPNLNRRLLHGGLPSFFLSPAVPQYDFQEWMDSYWAKDVQELFRLERRHSFQKFAELLFMQSGGIFEATRFAKPCEVSRSTVMNYLSVLEATFVVHVIRPYNSHRSIEIVASPKVYAFDTGFVSYYRGWNELRAEDLGFLWEHFVLNEMQADLQSRDIRYWRDKRGHEIDFVVAPRGRPPIAIECKWKAANFDPAGLLSFRKQYPKGKNIVAAHDVKEPFTRRYGHLPVRFTPLSDLSRAIHSSRSE